MGVDNSPYAYPLRKKPRCALVSYVSLSYNCIYGHTTFLRVVFTLFLLLTSKLIIYFTNNYRQLFFFFYQNFGTQLFFKYLLWA